MAQTSRDQIDFSHSFLTIEPTIGEFKALEAPGSGFISDLLCKICEVGRSRRRGFGVAGLTSGKYLILLVIAISFMDCTNLGGAVGRRRGGLIRTCVNAVVLVIVIGLAGLSRHQDGPPFEPDEALHTFELADGFQIEVFAAEPLVSDPVDMEIDEAGRIYVVEMPGYPLDTSPSGRIMLLSDTDGDGRPDSSTVFAAGFTLPTGVTRWKNGILVTAAPDVFYLEDTDGDGRADVREVVLTGFALSNPQHNFNNPLYALDNGIHLANSGPIGTETFEKDFGDKGSDVRFVGKYAAVDRAEKASTHTAGEVHVTHHRPDSDEHADIEGGGSRLGVNAGGRNVRFRPDTGELFAESSSSQFGHDFDVWGRHFLVSNANHQYVELVAARYLKRNPALPVRDVLESTPEHGAAAAVYPITLDPEHTLLTDRGVFTSAAGITYYNGGTFGEPYDQAVFVAEPVHNLVHADVVSPNGVSFVAERLFESREFLASTDSWFRPVNFYIGPDGALYVVDYYREIVEHPEWMEDDEAQTRDLYRGRDRGRIYRISRNESDAPSWIGKLSLGDASTRDLVALLSHDNRWWRLQAQRLLVDRGGKDAEGPLRGLLRTSSSALGRLHALWTLEGLGLVKRDDVLQALSDPVAGLRENGALLAERNGASTYELELCRMAADPDARVRFQVLLALGELDSRDAEEARRQILLSDLDDKWVQIASLSAGAPPTYAQLSRSIDALESDSRASAESFVRRVAMLVGSSGSIDDLASVVDLVIDAPEHRMAAAILGGLVEGIRQRSEQDVFDRPRVDALSDIFFTQADSALRGPVLDVFRIATSEEISLPTRSAALAVALSRDDDPAFRADALDLLALSNPSAFASDLRTLIRTHPVAEVESAAIRTLAQAPAADVADTLLAHWPRLSLAGREAALDAMMRSEERVNTLLDAVESGLISPSALGWARRVVLMRDWDGHVKQRARRLLRVSEANRVDVLKRYQEAIGSRGDPAAGRVVFAGACGSCHGIRGEASSFGPDLGTVSHWSPRALLEAILVPSRIVASGYEVWRIDRRNGDGLTGVLRAETATAITLIMPEGIEVTIPRQEIESMQQIGGSAMPDGLEEQITVDEMADLLTFLRGVGGLSD